MYNMFEFTLLPQFVHANEKPPTIYALLNSIVNFGKPDAEKVKIKDLAKAGHTKIFDFDYPLTENIKKEDFEVMILNKFLMRRIGFQTLTPFKIQLNVKLNEIMPLYNKMFDALENWNIFNDGETVTRTQDETRKSKLDNISKLDNTSNNNIEDISDRRYSDTPQSHLKNIKDGSYVTDYNYDTNTTKSNNTTNSNGEDNNKIQEKIERTPANKIEIYKEFKENIQSIYSMIFKDLEELFYQIY